MNNKNFQNFRNLSIAEQDLRIKNKFPQFKAYHQKNHQEKTWIGELQPTKWSPSYKIKIVYKFNISPIVNVLKPNLILAKGKSSLPHVYSNNELCLFLPKKHEWTSNHFIADTIIPWTSEWLFYYEDWVYSGNWKGGGEHPQRKQKNKDSKKNKRKIKI